MKECIYHSQILHTHTHVGIVKQQLNLQPAICFIYRVHPVLHPDILTQVYNKISYSLVIAMFHHMMALIYCQDWVQCSWILTSGYSIIIRILWRC